MKTTFIRLDGAPGGVRADTLGHIARVPTRGVTHAKPSALLLVGCSALLSACAGEAGTEQTLLLPAREIFTEVGAVLRGQCGSLDCHGHVARNFRVYGLNGLRLTGVPDREETSELELDATFYSLVALEPEALDLVVKDAGAQADQLILIKKGRGAVHHKGAEAMTAGGPADRCLLSWFTGVVDRAACDEGDTPTPPDGL